MGEFPSGQRGQTVNLLLLASMVRIHPLPPYMANGKDVRLEKRVFTRFFAVLTLKNFYTKPKMTFAAFEGKTGVELSHLELIGIIRVTANHPPAHNEKKPRIPIGPRL